MTGKPDNATANSKILNYPTRLNTSIL